MTHAECAKYLTNCQLELKKKSERSATRYTANEISRLCETALNAAEHIAEKGVATEHVVEAIELLERAKQEAENYSKPSHGFDAKTFGNSKFDIQKFMQPARAGVDQLILAYNQMHQ